MTNTPVKAYLAESAWLVIATETARTPALETGGLLIGRRIYYGKWPLLFVLHASGPGSSAFHDTLQFAPDHETLQAELVKWRSHFARYEVDYIGEWHKHPPEIPHPSRGDVQQARRILADSSYELPEGDLLLPISRIEDDAVGLDVYYIGRDTDAYVELPYEVAPLDTLCEFLDDVLAGGGHRQQAETLEPQRDRAEEPKPASGRRAPARPNGQSTQRMDVSDYDPAKVIEGRLIQGGSMPRIVQYGEPSVQPEPDGSSTHSGVDLATLRLSREVERLRRVGRRCGFDVIPSPAFDQLELVLGHPICLRTAGLGPQEVSPASVDSGEANSSPEAQPAPEHVVKVVLYLGDYPAEAPLMWLQTDRRSIPVQPATGTGRDRALPIEQMVERLFRNLADDLKPDGPFGSLLADLEYQARRMIHVSAATIKDLSEFYTRIEADFNRGFDFGSELRVRPLRGSNAGHHT